MRRGRHVSLFPRVEADRHARQAAPNRLWNPHGALKVDPSTALLQLVHFAIRSRTFALWWKDDLHAGMDILRDQRFIGGDRSRPSPEPRGADCHRHFFLTADDELRKLQQ